MAYKSLSFPQTAPTDDVEKSPVSHTVLAHSKQDLRNKKRRPNREHRCDAGQIPSEGQVRIILTILECWRGVNYVYLFSEGLWVFIVV